VFTGVYSVVGILAALAQREKTGKGCLVDTALLDSQVGVLANQALNFLTSGDVPQRIGNAHPNVVPYQVFAVADGHVIIAVGNDRQFAKLCEVLGAPGLANEADYKTNTDRLNNRPALIAKLDPLMARFNRDDLLEKLEAVQEPSGPINMLDQVFANPQVKHRGMQINPKSAAAKAGNIPGVRTPIVLDGDPMASPRPAPRLGEHSQEILREIGEA
jgi:crotonobetainyl-CoA:carnitine CoA-transferase CaiB-like acyl-CoA transferase